LWTKLQHNQLVLVAKSFDKTNFMPFFKRVKTMPIRKEMQTSADAHGVMLGLSGWRCCQRITGIVRIIF
jgi:hypothetical protein